MTERFGIHEDHWRKIIDLFARSSKLQKAILFGSRALHKYQPGSDIDIALVGENLDSVSDLGQIQLDYEDLYLPWKLDLINYASIANHDLKDHIDRVGITLWSRDSTAK